MQGATDIARSLQRKKVVGATHQNSHQRNAFKAFASILPALNRAAASRPLALKTGKSRRATSIRAAADAFGFDSSQAHLAWLEKQDGLPQGFAVGTAKLDFTPEEAPEMSAVMALTVIKADQPTEIFGAVTTSNKFPGAPVKVLRRRLQEPLAQAVVINNKVSNVCPGGDGEADAERICAAAAEALNISDAKLVLPGSTGVIGWKLPVAAMEAALPDAAAALQPAHMLPAAEAIMTTDRYPKLRSRTLSNGARVVGIAKGAGMIEPNMATMLSFVLTDLAVPRKALRDALSAAADTSFNCISIDSDESTSDMLVCLSSGKKEASDMDVQEFREELQNVCQELARDVVRNGEGTEHVIQVCLTNANKLSRQEMRDLGRAIVNSPLFKCAVAGNDPNVGRLVAAIGKCAGRLNLDVDPSKVLLKLGGEKIFEKGKFSLDGSMEQRLSGILKDATMPSEAPYPQHDRVVDIEVDLGHGGGKEAGITVWGSDLTKEYVSINADYRS